MGDSGTGLKVKRSQRSITNPARAIAAAVSRSGWQPPSIRGQKVASARRCRRA